MQASKAMMGKAISPLAASKHRKCVKATSRLVPSPWVCVSVWASEREENMCEPGIITCSSLCVYICVFLGGSKPDRILRYERQDVKCAAALMSYSCLCVLFEVFLDHGSIQLVQDKIIFMYSRWWCNNLTFLSPDPASFNFNMQVFNDFSRLAYLRMSGF